MNEALIPTLLSDDRRFRNLTDGWVQAVWECDRFGVIGSESPSWSAFTGQTVEEWTHYGWADTIHPADRAGVLEHWRAAFEKCSPVDIEFRIRKRDGSWVWTNVRAAPADGDEGSTRRWLGLNLDCGPRRQAQAALRETEGRYRHIVESARDHAILTVDAAGAITSWSTGAARTYGWSEIQAIGRPFSILLPHEERGEAMLKHVRSARHTVGGSFSAWHVRKDGSSVFIEGSTTALLGDSKESGFLLIGKDATERQRMERELAESEVRYRTLIESISDHAVFLVDPNGLVTEWTSAAEFVTGYSAAEVVGRHISLFYTPEEIASGAVEAELVEAALRGRTEREGWRVHRSGRRIWSDEVTTALRDAKGAVAGFSKVTRDLTERQSLRAAGERERTFAQRDLLRRSSALAEEDERRRIARELHDTAGQHVTALSLGLSALARRIEKDSPAERQVRALRDLTDLLSIELHDVAVRLRPRALDEFGFEEAIAASARSWSRHTDIAIDVHVAIAAERLSPEVENALYRIVQEALTNVARHSGAARTSVLVERRDGHVHAIVEDDGVGFDTNERHEGSFGLLGIRERVASMNGSFEIESEPGHGTTMFVRLPA